MPQDLHRDLAQGLVDQRGSLALAQHPRSVAQLGQTLASETQMTNLARPLLYGLSRPRRSLV